VRERLEIGIEIYLTLLFASAVEPRDDSEILGAKKSKGSREKDCLLFLQEGDGQSRATAEKLSSK
jgi:hypothetical protein